MNFFEKLTVLEKLCAEGAWADRVCSETLALNKLSEDRGGCWRARIEGACDAILAAKAREGAVTKSLCLRIERSLSDLAPEIKAYTGIFAAHAHIDMNWMWGYQETASITVDTFRTMLDLMKEYPSFTFSQSQASAYAIIERHAPEMLKEIRRRVREGRWEVTASTWVETDKNMPDGESLARHILYTKRYLSNLLGIDPASLKIDFEPDTFGHNATVPEILQEGGVDYYYHCRGRKQKDVGSPLFNWESPSGRRVLAYCEPFWYGYGPDLLAPSLTAASLGYCDACGVKTFLRVYGVGDHGGGPSRRDVERILDMSRWPLFPTLKFGTFREFFDAVLPDRDKFPTHRGEINTVFTGCYTSQSRIKMANRVAEARMNEAEFLSVAANTLVGAPSKSALLASAWRGLLFNHFHDILPGSGTVETREYAMGQFQDVLATAGTTANLAMRALAEAIDTSSIPFDKSGNATSEGAGVGFNLDQASGFGFTQADRGRGKVRAFHLFNTLGVERHAVVPLTVWDYTGDLSLLSVTDEAGNPVPFAVTEDGTGYWGHRYAKVSVEVTIKPFGYRTLILSEKALACDRTGENVFFLDRERSDEHISDEPFVMENEKIRATLSAQTLEVLSLTDKERGKEVISSPACVFRLVSENPMHGMTAWRIGPARGIQNLNESADVRFTGRQTTALSDTIRYHVKFGSSEMDVSVSLSANDPLLRFTARVDWHELPVRGESVPQLNFFVPVNYAVSDYRYDIPYDILSRPSRAQDVPANSYMELPAADGRSVFLVSGEKYGFRGVDHSGAITLIRSSYDPDPYPELGIHDVRLALGVADSAAVYDLAAAYRHPIPSIPATGHAGNLPLCGQVFDVKGDARVAAVKNPEEGAGLILRLFAPSGADAAATLTFPFPVSSAALLDLNENRLASLPLDGNSLSVQVPAHSVVTVRVE